MFILFLYREDLFVASENCLGKQCFLSGHSTKNLYHFHVQAKPCTNGLVKQNKMCFIFNKQTFTGLEQLSQIFTNVNNNLSNWQFGNCKCQHGLKIERWFRHAQTSRRWKMTALLSVVLFHFWNGTSCQLARARNGNGETSNVNRSKWRAFSAAKASKETKAVKDQASSHGASFPSPPPTVTRDIWRVAEPVFPYFELGGRGRKERRADRVEWAGQSGASRDNVDIW